MTRVKRQVGRRKKNSDKTLQILFNHSPYNSPFTTNNQFTPPSIGGTFIKPFTVAFTSFRERCCQDCSFLPPMPPSALLSLLTLFRPSTHSPLFLRICLFIVLVMYYWTASCVFFLCSASSITALPFFPLKYLTSPDIIPAPFSPPVLLTPSLSSW